MSDASFGLARKGQTNPYYQTCLAPNRVIQTSSVWRPLDGHEDRGFFEGSRTSLVIFWSFALGTKPLARVPAISKSITPFLLKVEV